MELQEDIELELGSSLVIQLGEVASEYHGGVLTKLGCSHADYFPQPSHNVNPLATAGFYSLSSYLYHCEPTPDSMIPPNSIAVFCSCSNA